MKSAPTLALAACALSLSSAYAPSKKSLSRRDFGILTASSAAAPLLTRPDATLAFDGTGSTAYSGKSVTSKAALRKSYQDRVAADVRDFNALGSALAKGETTETAAWVNFFTPYARRTPDDVGRTYAALADFIGHIGEGKKLEGGDGYLLAATFAKQGKPPENLPSVKCYNALFKAFDPIQAAGKKGDAAKARAAWEKAVPLFEAYLAEVEMPGSLSDPLYN